MGGVRGIDSDEETQTRRSLAADCLPQSTSKNDGKLAKNNSRRRQF